MSTVSISGPTADAMVLSTDTPDSPPEKTTSTINPVIVGGMTDIAVVTMARMVQIIRVLV